MPHVLSLAASRRRGLSRSKTPALSCATTAREPNFYDLAVQFTEWILKKSSARFCLAP
jgi:hypothetical protein